jgi:hypothetical protein
VMIRNFGILTVVQPCFDALTLKVHALEDPSTSILPRKDSDLNWRLFHASRR